MGFDSWYMRQPKTAPTYHSLWPTVWLHVWHYKLTSLTRVGAFQIWVHGLQWCKATANGLDMIHGKRHNNTTEKNNKTTCICSPMCAKSSPAWSHVPCWHFNEKNNRLMDIQAQLFMFCLKLRTQKTTSSIRSLLAQHLLSKTFSIFAK